jgi:hypothetical protein
MKDEVDNKDLESILPYLNTCNDFIKEEIYCFKYMICLNTVGNT